MNWTIEFTKSSRKQLEAIGAPDRARIAAFLRERVASHTDPRQLAKKLVGERDLWRFRVGDYRLITSIEDGRCVVLVIAIGHRREIYR